MSPVWDLIRGLPRLAVAAALTLAKVKSSTAPIWPQGFAPMAASAVQASVLAHAGARPADRDATDQRNIDSVTKKSGDIYNCLQTCVAPKNKQVPGGWPTLAVNTKTFAVVANPNGDDDHDGYSNLEEQLHAYAANVE